MFILQCENCKQDFETSHRTARYCSNYCKSMAFKQKAQKEQEPINKKFLTRGTIRGTGMLANFNIKE